MRNYKHSKAVKEIADKYDVHPSVVNIVLVSFFNGLRKLLKRNEDIHIKGYFRITMRKYYRDKVRKLGKSYNPRARKHKKRY
jgi:hypothetical protein